MKRVDSSALRRMRVVALRHGVLVADLPVPPVRDQLAASFVAEDLAGRILRLCLRLLNCRSAGRPGAADLPLAFSIGLHMPALSHLDPLRSQLSDPLQASHSTVTHDDTDDQDYRQPAQEDQ